MSIFDVGTKTLFQQTSAPTGWTKETVNYNNHALRIVNGVSLTTGGTVDFTTAFTTSAYTYSGVPMPYNVGSRTLSTAQLPHHTHTIGPGAASPTTNFFLAGTNDPAIPVNGVAPTTPVQQILVSWVLAQAGANVGGSGSHNHPVEITASGNVFSPNSTLAVNYIDVIIASKN